MDHFFELPLMLYSTARSAGFTLQFQLLQTLESALPTSRRGRAPRISPATQNQLRKDLLALFKLDSQNIANGIYPAAVLKPESPLHHMMRLPKLLADGMTLHLRRNRGDTKEFNPKAQEMLSELPRYYRRNFHFQTDGYLSEKSADLYEHQVEMLFSGGADAMRRLIIPAMHRHFGSTDGKGLRFLEVGAGTGRATRFMRLAFPKAKIVATDLSEPYLKIARKRLNAFQRIDFVQSDGAALPFADGHFDSVYSVFLFHELPFQARVDVLKEAHRVLKPGGIAGLVDSIQLGDQENFEPLLKRYPQDFHEPFFRDYIARPIEGLLKQAGFRDVDSRRGFFSKVVSGVRTA